MAPAWTLPMELRTKLHADAVRLTAAAKYKNAGTVEFLVDAEGRYYFIEVNPRIQVCSSDVNVNVNVNVKINPRIQVRSSDGV